MVCDLKQISLKFIVILSLHASESKWNEAQVLSLMADFTNQMFQVIIHTMWQYYPVFETLKHFNDTRENLKAKYFT